MLRSAKTEAGSKLSAVPAGRVAPVNMLLGLVVAGVALLLWTGAAASRAAVSSTLYAGFDADGNIQMTFADGTMIGTFNPPGTIVPVGTYTISVNNNSLDDMGYPHQFHLFGPGVNVVPNAVQSTVTVTFQASSTYVYQDDLNPSTIREVFGTPGSGATNTAPATAPTVPTPTSSGGGKPVSIGVVGSQVVPFRGTLAGGVSTTGKLTLTVKGKPVSTLKAGRYTIKVADHSATHGFTLQEIRKAAATVTGSAFVGNHTVSVNLKAGQWFFYTTFVAKKTYFIVVG